MILAACSRFPKLPQSLPLPLSLPFVIRLCSSFHPVVDSIPSILKPELTFLPKECSGSNIVPVLSLEPNIGFMLPLVLGLLCASFEHT